MASSDRPRTTLEALFEHPLIGSDNGEQGIGPTLGENVGGPLTAPGRPMSEARAFADRRSTLAATTAHAPLGSEIFRASRGFRAGILRPGGLPVAPSRPADQTRAAETKGEPDADDGL